MDESHAPRIKRDTEYHEQQMQNALEELLAKANNTRMKRDSSEGMTLRLNPDPFITKASHSRLKRNAEENDHEEEMRNIQKALEKLYAKENNPIMTRDSSDGMRLRLNPGAFIRKATNNGGDNTLSTYFTYSGSLTTPGKQYAR